jgi:protein TonB
MKRTLFIILLHVSATTIYAQQPPPKTPKDPDSTTINNTPVGTNTQTSLDTSKVYGFVEQKPSFPGGPEKWSEYVKANLKYPDGAKANDLQGIVFVTFVVERDGSITDPKILRGIGDPCDEEAKRLIKNSPKWNPAMQDGKVVRAHSFVTVEFKL